MGIMNAPMMLAASSGDDVDFMVHGLIPLKFFGHKVWITTTHVTTLIVMVFIIVLALIARHAVLHGDEKPSGLQNFVEMIVEMLDNLVKGSMGRHWRPFVNYIGTIMVFIFFANTSGLFGLRPPTADYGTTLALALITCGAAVATSSMATELVKGKNIQQALEVTNKAVMEALDGLPPVKVHCSLLAEEAIHAALWDYAAALCRRACVYLCIQ